MTNRYPWSVQMRPEESIPSMLERLSEVTGLTVRQLYPHNLAALADGPDIKQLRVAAAVLGVDTVQLRMRTLQHRFRRRHLPPAGPSELRPPAGLRCPGCGTAPLWSRLVLVTTCPECGLLLTGDREPVAAPTVVIEMQRSYLAHLRAPRAQHAERFRRMWRIIKLAACIGWNPAPYPGAVTHTTLDTTRAMTLDVPAGFATPPRSAVWKSPRWIASLAEHAWPRTVTDHATRLFIGGFTLDYLIGPGLASPSEAPVEVERARLHDHLRAIGLAPSMIPDYVRAGVGVLEAGCHGEEVGNAIARALLRESLHAHSGQRPTITVIDQLCGETDVRHTATALTQKLGATTRGLSLLHREATMLAQDGRCDYRRRRESLVTLRSVPATVLAHSGIRTTHQTSRLAAAWIWLELTHGILRIGPHRGSLRRSLREFDRQLSPEARLVLREYGHEHLDAVNSDLARAARAALVAPKNRPDDAEARRTDVG